MKLWLALAVALAGAAPAARAAAQEPAALPMPAQTAAQVRSDSLAQAALAATTPAQRVFVDVRTWISSIRGAASGAPVGEARGEERRPGMTLGQARRPFPRCPDAPLVWVLIEDEGTLTGGSPTLG